MKLFVKFSILLLLFVNFSYIACQDNGGEEVEQRVTENTESNEAKTTVGYSKGRIGSDKKSRKVVKERKASIGGLSLSMQSKRKYSEKIKPAKTQKTNNHNKRAKQTTEPNVTVEK